ncbi:unnamed protein product [Blepharisma stoltei]|uniref:Calmodulin n=1 Tax=Blepharisma stoltei TaxID=1481888 RepID=A0AAU9JKZ0_9CILI|nr:unnamed protein product [Blepharisma stoltei]
MYGLNDTEWEDCQDLFNMLDTNRNKTIDIGELISGFHELGLIYTEDEVNALLTECDKDQSGELSLQEFANVYRKALRATSMSEEEVRYTFKMLDSNRSGTLSKAELKRHLADSHITFSDREIDVLLRDFDENYDNELDIDEFLHSALGFQQ